jgi:hypothetical protein
MITRSDYFETPQLRQDYYMQFANKGILASVAIYFPIEELRASTSDVYFNDINLRRWRSCARYIRPWLNVELLKESGEVYSEIFAVNLCKVVARSFI